MIYSTSLFLQQQTQLLYISFINTFRWPIHSSTGASISNADAGTSSVIFVASNAPVHNDDANNDNADADNGAADNNDNAAWKKTLVSDVTMAGNKSGNADVST